MVTVELLLSLFLALPQDSSGQKQDLMRRPYLDLLELREVPVLSKVEVDALESRNKQERKAEDARLKKVEKQIEKDLKAARKRMDDLNREKPSRNRPETQRTRDEIHCEVLRLESELKKTRTEREKGLPVIYQNRSAKLDLIQKWPAMREKIEREVEAGVAQKRHFGNIDDIGVRDLGIADLAAKQQADIRSGQDAIHDMKSEGLMPPEFDDKEVTAYIRRLAEEIAHNSDLRVPIKVVVLDSMEINAFALPGGHLFVNTGLIHKAESESELAGVLAHEIAHAAARHGPRLMKRAKIMDLIFQAAEVGAVVLTGGAASYPLQYGFYGVGMFIDLSLLGVSREFEAEADQLGAQYAWKAGYDPRGFITFFDRMANEEGYVKSASFFRTHPPFLERILSTFSEITYLPEKTNLLLDSSAFLDVKERMAELNRLREREAENKPSLRGDAPECGKKP